MSNNSAHTLSSPAVLACILTGAAMPALISGRAVLAAAFIAAVLCFPFMRERSECWSRVREAVMSWIGLVVVLIVVSWLPSVLASEDMTKSFTTVLRSGLFVGLSCLLWSVLAHSQRTCDLVQRSLVISLGIMISLSLISLFAFPEVYGLIHGWGWVDVDTPGKLKAAASLCALLIPVMLWAGYRLGGPWRICVLGILAGFIAIIVMTSSRSSIAGILGAVAAVCILIVIRRRSLVLGLCLVSVVAVTIFAGLSWVSYTRKDHGPVPVDNLVLPSVLADWHRQGIWGFVWDQGKDNRWFGTGANAINKADYDRTRVENTGGSAIPNHPHNWIIEVMVETGFVGLATLMLGIALFMWRLARDYIRSGDLALLAVVGVWGVYWTSGLFNFSYWSSWWQVSFLLSTAICLAGRSDRSMNISGKV